MVVLTTVAVLHGLSVPAAARCRWAVFKPPSYGEHSLLAGVTAVASDDVWAFGTTMAAENQFQHFDGSSWSPIAAPSLPASTSLWAIKARSTNDVWGVGSQTSPSGADQALIVHWNGASWSVVPNPAQDQNSSLLSVAIVGRTDVWAAGYVNTRQGGNRPLIEHYNGQKWAVDSSYSPPSQSILQAIAGTSLSNIWTGGYYDGGASALIETRDRRAHTWNQSVSAVGNYISSMSARSSTDVWATGPPELGGLFVEQWNGAQWNPVQYPRGGNAVIAQVDATANSGFTWFVGDIFDGYETVPFVDRFRDGWTDMKVVKASRHHTLLNSVTTVPGSTDVWVAGGYGPSASVEYNLAERYTCH